jgi:hypothetical protein
MIFSGKNCLKVAVILFISFQAFATKQVDWDVQITPNGDEIISKVNNPHSSPLLCSIAYNVAIKGELGRDKGVRSISYDGFLVRPNKEYALFIQKENLAIENEGDILSEIKNFSKPLVCVEASASILNDLTSMSTLLKNNHFIEAQEIYNSSANPTSLKYLDVTSSYFSLPIEDMNYFNFAFIEMYNTPAYENTKTTSDACMLRQSKLCGYEYFNKVSEFCPVGAYSEKASASCGVKQYQKCIHSDCGREWTNARKQCRTAACGVEEYKMCRHASHGAQDIISCTSKEHGTKNVKSCKIKISASGEARRCR